MTWILCGTSSLRSIDNSELGERFLDCVIMQGIDSELEDEVLWRVANKADKNMAIEADGTLETEQEPEMTTVKQLTGGYIQYLRENAQKLFAEITIPTKHMLKCTRLGKFVAFMRARPSESQEETAEREFAARLVSQHIRLAKCLALVLNKKQVDNNVMQRVTNVAMDTARGRTLEIVRYLQGSEEGLTTKSVSMYIVAGEQTTRKLLRFLRKIEVLEGLETKRKGVRAKQTWRLSQPFRKLYDDVMEEG
jgi:hypothetical protein